MSDNETPPPLPMERVELTDDEVRALKKWVAGKQAADPSPPLGPPGRPLAGGAPLTRSATLGERRARPEMPRWFLRTLRAIEYTVILVSVGTHALGLIQLACGFEHTTVAEIIRGWSGH
jgi:hypothetical protein